MTALLALLLAPFTAIIRHMRKLDLSRGSIDMTDARTLWEQADNMREELAARVASLEGRVTSMLDEIGSLRIALAESMAREGLLRSELAFLTDRLRRFENATTTRSGS